jgi:FkbM family methyltransferase
MSSHPNSCLKTAVIIVLVVEIALYIGYLRRNSMALNLEDGEHVWYSHYNLNLPTVEKCTEEQRSKIEVQLGLSHNRVKGLSGCFDADWLDAFFEEEEDIGTEHFIGISVGCNVGTDAINTARMGMSDPKFDVFSWIDALGEVVPPVCGKKNRQGATNFPLREGEMHCIEPMPSNALVLNNAIRASGVDEGRFVVSHAAISSSNGVVKFPNGGPGYEACGMQGCQHADEGIGLVDVNVYSLDYYVSKFVKGRGPINVLSVDVEGWDFDALFGASSVLDRTYYLEFEYHKVGEFHFIFCFGF